jgi:hypothetical protein
MGQKLLTVLVAGFAIGALGAERGWHLQIGASYRSFGDVEVESYKLRNYDAMDKLGGPLGIQGYAQVPGLQDGSGVTADRVLFRGADAAADGVWAPVLGVQKDLWRRGSLSLRLTAGLAYYTVDADLAAGEASGRLAASHYNYLIADGQVLVPSINDEPLRGFSPGTSAQFQLSHFQTDLLVFDLGLRAQYDLKRVYVGVGIGPAFYWAETDSEVLESGSWNAIPGTGDPGSYHRRRSDSASDTTLGLFGSLTAGVHVSRHVSVELEGRLDGASGNVGTSQAKLGLNGHSAQVRVVFDF